MHCRGMARRQRSWDGGRYLFRRRQSP